jgi:hypothetical protein
VPPLLGLSTWAPPAAASVARALTLDELVSTSTFVVVASAGEKKSVWEEQPSGRRIVTYTRLAVERTVAGAAPQEIWVRTLGGAVDHIGQAVPGEAQIPTGSRAMLFLTQANGVTVVTAMAQGHYPITIDGKGTPRLTPNGDPGMLLPRPGPSITAGERLVGSALEDAITLVKQIGKARDEKK